MVRKIFKNWHWGKWRGLFVNAKRQVSHTLLICAILKLLSLAKLVDNTVLLLRCCPRYAPFWNWCILSFFRRNRCAISSFRGHWPGNKKKISQSNKGPSSGGSIWQPSIVRGQMSAAVVQWCNYNLHPVPAWFSQLHALWAVCCPVYPFIILASRNNPFSPLWLEFS